jgi:hypothetical protein
MSANQDGYFAGARLLARDVRVAALLLREGRNRACARLFGVSSEDSAIVTLIALATLAHTARGRVHDLITAPGAPTAGDTLIGAGLLTETVHVIAGDWSREVPVVPAIIVGAVIAHHLRPWERIALHDARAMAHRLRVDFDHRYGHLIRPNRRPRAATQPDGSLNRSSGVQSPG